MSSYTEAISIMIQRIKMLEQIRVMGNAISDRMKTNDAGDQITYEGGMNTVEMFRDAEADYVSFLFKHGMLGDKSA